MIVCWVFPQTTAFKLCKQKTDFWGLGHNLVKMDYYIVMQANCLVFPSPKHFDLAPIHDKILLIPTASNNNRHSIYNRLCTSHSFSSKDDFADYLASLEQSSKAEYTRKKSQNVTQGDNENSVIEGNLNTKEKVSCEDYIPCLFLPGSKSKIIVFFHANGEDISSAYDFLKLLNLQTRYPVLAMEYRGYSIYEGETSPKNIAADAARVIEFLQANKLASDQIILFGRSIGCAVALTLTQKYSIHSAVLLSPFISLKKIAGDLYGSCAGALIKEGFDNEENCRQIKCPLLIIHGNKDNLVPYEHSLRLMSGCQAYCRLKLVENMTHTKFNFRLDFIRHFSRFMADLE